MGSTRRRRALALGLVLSCAVLPARAGAAPAPGAMADAVADLDADHDTATAAVYTLQSGGAAAAQAIRDAWSSLSPIGKERVLTAVSALARAHDAALDTLVQAARSDNERLQKRSLSALRRLGARGRRGLVMLLPDPQVGDRAALALAQTDPDFAIEPLLAELSRKDGENRLQLRDALATAVRRGEHADTRLAQWLDTEPPSSAVASAAMGLASSEAQRATVTSLLEYALPRSSDFAATWRMLKAAGAAGPSTKVDRWLRAQLTNAEAWMLREAAVDALAMRGYRADVRASLDDPYPRVRASAATALAGDPESLVDRATLARRDTWPMVRAAAVSGLAGEPKAVPIVVAAVDDSMSLVRAAAIEALRLASHHQGWERVHERLRAPDEWPRVTRAAIDYAAAHCRGDAVDALLMVVLRARSSHALTEDLNSAARAIEALRVLGTPEAREVIEQLRRTESVPPTLKMALERSLPQERRCIQAP